MCGLIGFSGREIQNEKKDKFKYNTDKIKLLMYYNSIERKSTDSCGYYQKGMTDPDKSVQSANMFLRYGTNKALTESSSLFIGHVRSKSVGAVSQRNAHPFRVKNLIGAHNGTISNIEKICKAYDVKHNNSVTDSYLMLQCLSIAKNPDPFLMVEGSCTFMFTDLLSPDTLYVYKKERELFYGYHIEGMYISSERSSLELIGCTGINAFDDEHFYIIENSVILTDFKKSDLIKKVETVWHSTILQDRWIRANKNNYTYGLIKDEWYLIDSVRKIGDAYCNFELCDGRLDKHPYKITAKSKVGPIGADFFDYKDAQPLIGDAYKGRITKAMYTANVGEGDKKKTAFEKDDYIILTDKDLVKNTYTAYCPMRDITVSGIDVFEFRDCTKEEEEEFRVLLSTIKDDITSPHKDNIKFGFLPKVELDDSLARFNQILLASLDSINKEVYNTTTLDELKKTLNKKITMLKDNVEQVMQDKVDEKA